MTAPLITVRKRVEHLQERMHDLDAEIERLMPSIRAVMLDAAAITAFEVMRKEIKDALDKAHSDLQIALCETQAALDKLG